MCGIAGLHYYRDPQRPVDPTLLNAMTDVLAHRGPDGRGIWSKHGIGLGHRRLKILDLSENAAQPMSDDQNRLVLTYNGEIYNFRELRSELEQLGHKFRSTSDTEVILKGYREWGVGVLERLIGIFAFALWDQNEQQLFLARDSAGVKPLFYSVGDSTFWFASEIKAILQDPAVDREIDLEAIDTFFTFSYTPAPLTGLKKVKQLLPGHYLLVTRDGAATQKFLCKPEQQQHSRRDFSAAVEEFGDLFDTVVTSQMISDVPFGVFLSGGLDSACIAHSMKSSGTAPHAVTVAFSDKAFDESCKTRATASRLEVPLSVHTVDYDPIDLVEKIAAHLEEPTADSSSFAVYQLCKVAREHFTVALSGDGADELLAGYTTYLASFWAPWYRKIPRFIRRPLASLLQTAIPVRDARYSTHEVIRRFTEGAEKGEIRDHASWRIIF